MIETWKVSLMQAIAERARTLDGLHQHNHFAALALRSLYDSEYIEAWGGDWNTCLFVATKRGREWLASVTNRE